MEYLLFTLVVGRVLGDIGINLPPKIYYDLNEAKDLFDKYVVQFNKQYDDDEYITRLAIFKENLEEINEFNQESNMTVYDINQFTDLKHEEVFTSYMGLRGNITFTDSKEYKTFRYAPKKLDYREKGFVTEVKNQGHCNSCYIFSAVGSIEGQHAKVHGALISLSEQQGLDCQDGGDCAYGGFPLNTMKVLALQGGAMSSKDYPYVTKKQACRTQKDKIVVKVTGGFQILVKNEDYLKSALAEYGPLSIGLTACSHLSNYRGGVFNYNCVGNDKHAVLLVGYDTSGTVPYWIMKNSWNTVWGDQGYLYMEMGKGLCNIGSYVAVATVT